ncbi:DNA-binding protein [Planctomycetales bacterium ZRK34]|nr:DNA-binding protein [Planctomycetales bacterium ZRK34]
MKMMYTGRVLAACLMLSVLAAAIHADDEPSVVGWEQAGEHVGEKVTVEGPVVATAYLQHVGGKPTFLNVGKPHPEPGRFTVVIWGKHRDNFDGAPEKTYADKKIRVTGVIKMHKNNPEIIVKSPDQIQIVE